MCQHRSHLSWSARCTSPRPFLLGLQQAKERPSASPAQDTLPVNSPSQNRTDLDDYPISCACARTLTFPITIAYFCVCVWSILSNLIPCPSSQDITGLHFTHEFMPEQFKRILTRRFSSRLMVAQSSAVGKAEKVVCPLSNFAVSLNILNLQEAYRKKNNTVSFIKNQDTFFVFFHVSHPSEA